MNLFGTVLTYTAPSANYRGESAENRAVIQKITKDRFEYAIISPEAIRNALRETIKLLGLPCNRERLGMKAGKSKGEGEDEEKQQLAVKFSEYPDPKKFADDFFFGYLMAIKGKEIEKLRKEKGADYDLKRDSIMRMNMAVALEPYRHCQVFTQSPLLKDSPWKPGGGEQKVESALLLREEAFTPFQYPFALNLDDCKEKPDWTKILIKAIGELNDVAGNHARSYFEFAPASVVIRLTEQLVAGYDTYGFRIEREKLNENNEKHVFPEVIEGIKKGDYPGSEFYIGGKIIKDMDDASIKELEEKGVKTDRNPQKLLEKVAQDAFPSK